MGGDKKTISSLDPSFPAATLCTTYKRTMDNNLKPGARARLNSTEKRLRRQRNARFQIEHQVLSKIPPPKKVMAWSGGNIAHNKDVALLAYLQRVQREGKSLTSPQTEALERILQAKGLEHGSGSGSGRALQTLVASTKKKEKEVEFRWDDEDDSDEEDSSSSSSNRGEGKIVKLATRPARLGVGATHLAHSTQSTGGETDEALVKKLLKSEKRRRRREEEEREIEEEEEKRRRGETNNEGDSRAGALTSRSDFKKKESVKEKEKEEERKRTKREIKLRKKLRKKEKKKNSVAEDEVEKEVEKEEEKGVKSSEENGVVVARKSAKSEAPPQFSIKNRFLLFY
jgi:hypothetical protein